VGTGERLSVALYEPCTGDSLLTKQRRGAAGVAASPCVPVLFPAGTDAPARARAAGVRMSGRVSFRDRSPVRLEHAEGGWWLRLRVPPEIAEHLKGLVRGDPRHGADFLEQATATLDAALEAEFYREKVAITLRMSFGADPNARKPPLEAPPAPGGPIGAEEISR
jgi:hypothetical protein